jgi:hypothetical protein
VDAPEIEARRHQVLSELVTAARRLEPDNLQWVRLSVMVQSDLGVPDAPGSHSRQVQWLPHQGVAWRELLEEAAQADPENALYDYLIADELWHESTETIYRQNDRSVPPRVVIHDQDLHDQSWQHLDKGLAKPYCRAGSAMVAAAARFLDASQLPPHRFPADQHHRILWRLENDMRLELLLRELAERQFGRADRQFDEGQFEAGFAHLKSIQRLADQFDDPDRNLSLRSSQLVNQSRSSEQRYLRGLQHP